MSASLVTITVVGVVRKKDQMHFALFLSNHYHLCSLCLSDVPLLLLGQVYC